MLGVVLGMISYGKALNAHGDPNCINFGGFNAHCTARLEGACVPRFLELLGPDACGGRWLYRGTLQQRSKKQPQAASSLISRAAAVLEVIALLLQAPC